MDDKLNKYIKKEIDSGSSTEAVIDTLIAAGWKKEKVKWVVRQFSEKDTDENQYDLEEETKKEIQEKNFDRFNAELKKSSERIRLFLFIIIIVLTGILIVGILFAFSFLEPEMIFS